MLHTSLKELGLDQEDTETYLYLLETGNVTAGKLAKKLGVPRSSLYGYLKKLVDKGLVVESQREGVKVFTAENPDKINQLFRERIERLQTEQQTYKTLLPDLRSKQPQKLLSPKLQMFEGSNGLQQVLKDMLLYSSMETQAFWPIAHMLDILSPDFFRYFNKERIKNNLYTRAVWPETQIIDIKDHPYLGSGNNFKREIRIAPKHIDISMGYWIYGNKVAFISSRKESFGFIIESQELVQTLQSQFELLWQVSQALNPDPKDSEEFLKNLF